MNTRPQSSSSAVTDEVRERDARVMDREAEHLQTRYPDVADVTEVRALMGEVYEELAAEASNPAMLVALTVNETTNRLRDRGRDQGMVESRHPRVLFVCHGNAGRSQMAAALLENRSGGAVRSRSAGTSPAGAVLPVALEVMADAGIPLHNAFPKPVDEDIVRQAELVVVFPGADEVAWPEGPEIRRWDVPTLTGMSAAEAAAVRADVESRVLELIDELQAAPAADGATTARETDVTV